MHFNLHKRITALILLIYLGHFKGFCIPPTDSLLQCIQASFTLEKGRAIPKKLLTHNNLCLVFYNQKNCSQCFFEISHHKNEKCILLVVQKTTDLAKYKFVKKYGSTFHDILFLNDFVGVDQMPKGLLEIYQNEVPTPVVCRVRDGTLAWEFMNYEK